MPTLTVTSPIEGKQPGETIDVSEGKAQWYLAQGYATDDDTAHDHLYDTSTEAALDPTLAANREHRNAEEPEYNPGGQAPEPDPEPDPEGPESQGTQTASKATKASTKK